VVQDNGVGIKPENIKKLFTNYSRLEEHQEINAKGTGLGLSICKNIIQQMGGNVDVKSELSVGSQFIITLQL
jgi:signal transduction histidine kinase